jgi:transposase InsO family protein
MAAKDTNENCCRHPQTNGMVERFNGRIADIFKQTRFSSAAELESTLISYFCIYNHPIPQRNIKHLTPIQSMEKWHEIQHYILKR